MKSPSRLQAALATVRLPMAALLVAGVAGCTSMSEEPPPADPSAAAIPSPETNESFPNLGSVPDQPPQVPSAAERQQVIEGLTSDRANAKYTDQDLRGQPSDAALPPPEPAPPPQTISTEPPPQAAPTAPVESAPIEPGPSSSTEPADPAADSTNTEAATEPAAPAETAPAEPVAEIAPPAYEEESSAPSPTEPAPTETAAAETPAEAASTGSTEASAPAPDALTQASSTMTPPPPSAPSPSDPGATEVAAAPEPVEAPYTTASSAPAPEPLTQASSVQTPLPPSAPPPSSTPSEPSSYSYPLPGQPGALVAPVSTSTPLPAPPAYGSTTAASGAPAPSSTPSPSASVAATPAAGSATVTSTPLPAPAMPSTTVPAMTAAAMPTQMATIPAMSSEPRTTIISSEGTVSGGSALYQPYQPQPYQTSTQPASYAGNAVTVDMGAIGGNAGAPSFYPAAMSQAYVPPPTQMALAQPAMGYTPGTAGGPAGIIYFSEGGAALDAKDRDVLNSVAAIYRQRGGTIRVVGHSSQDGAATYEAQQANLQLSWSRANAVAKQLAREGVDPGAIQADAVGANQPLYLESSTAGAAANRRVEIYFY